MTGVRSGLVVGAVGASERSDVGVQVLNEERQTGRRVTVASWAVDGGHFDCLMTWSC